ncbi:MAG: hypothetical protein IPI49_26385 [Myxococcales bacterium]|nr:hypothetical protein [Myxococcales bacterium]
MLRAAAELPKEAWRDVIAVVARTSAELVALRTIAPDGVVSGLEVIDDPARRAELTAQVAELLSGEGKAVHAPAFVLVRPAPDGPDELAATAGRGRAAGAPGPARMQAVPLADRLRNELAIPTVVVLDAGVRGEDLDAVIAAGRADLAVLPADAVMFGAEC